MADYTRVMLTHMRDYGCSEEHIAQTEKICSGAFGELYAPRSEDEAIAYARRHYEIAAEANAVGVTINEYVAAKSRFIPDKDYDPAFAHFMCDCEDCRLALGN